MELLILFTRFPLPGHAKTRLIPLLGEQGAAGLHKMMAELMFAVGRQLMVQRNTAVTVYYDGGEESAVREWVPKEFTIRQQRQGDLGERLKNAFSHEFAAGAKKVIVIGADCPFISPRVLDEAFTGLVQNDLVLGPAVDGGYYLMGLSRPAASLWDDIAWGTGTVLSQTLEAARKENLTTWQLAPLPDIDRPEDVLCLFDGNNFLSGAEGAD